jgi:hypothetical protein
MKHLLLVATLAACSRSEKAEPPAARPTLGEVERARSLEACTRYAQAICECSSKRPDHQPLRERCELDAALPSALQISLDLLDAPGTSHGDAEIAIRQSRKLAQTCFESLAQLPTLGC